jgi:hypothetical protein
MIAPSSARRVPPVTRGHRNQNARYENPNIMLLIDIRTVSDRGDRVGRDEDCSAQVQVPAIQLH